MRIRRLVSIGVPIMLLCGGSLMAQGRFSSSTGDVALVAAGTSFTVQQPSAGAKTVTFESATVYCSVACDITQSQNGTAATATAGTILPIQPNLNAPSATTWTASNVGAGAAVGGIIHLGATQTITIDLSQVSMGRTGTKTNYSFTISSITGTTNITILWGEK